MAPSQLEDVINVALKSGDFQGLEEMLQVDGLDETPMKCTQQFLTKLDKLIKKSLDQKDPKAAGLVYSTISKYGKNVKLPSGGQGFSGLLSQGLMNKSWQLWIECGPQWDKALFTLSEDFLNVLMVVHEASKEGTLKITEAFLYPVGQLVVDPRVYILIQKEAIRKFNFILDKIPAELKKDRKLLTSQESSDIMVKLAGKILEGGDYDCQSSLMEALCRMATADQRKELAYRWFSMGHVASAFANIRDSEFETASRKFLNMVNGMQGDRRRVYSYPCLEVFLDNNELLMPADEKLEEFWIDFNLCSRCISFYFTLADEERQQAHWETLSISESDVVTYTVTEQGKRKILQVKMSEVVVVGSVEGSRLTIHFSSSLDILKVAHHVYGQINNKIPLKKSGGAESSTQVVPESQVSLGGSERNTVPHPLFAQSVNSQKVTPAKTRVSESISFISGSAGKTVLSGRPSSKNKLSLEKIHLSSANSKSSSFSATLGRTNGFGIKVQCDTPSTASEQTAKRHTDQFKKNLSVSEVLREERSHKSQEQDIVLDTQPRAVRNRSTSLTKMSTSEMLMMPTQKMGSLPRPEPHSMLAETQERRQSSAQRWSVSDSTPVSLNRLNTELSHRLKKVLDEQSRDDVSENAAGPQQMILNAREGSKDKSSEKEIVAPPSTPRVRPVQRNNRFKQKSRDQMLFALKESVNPSLVKDKTCFVAEDQSSKASSGRDKNKLEATGSMVKLISSHYRVKAKSTTKCKADNEVTAGSNPPPAIRPTITMMWSSTFRKDVNRSLSHKKATEKSTKQKSDVFSFSIDSPMQIGGGNKTLTNISVHRKSNINESSSFLVSTKKEPPKPKSKRHVKKHLFSDTDTDNARTDHSWLRQSSRKPKVQVTKYSRQAPITTTAVKHHTSGESSNLIPPPSHAAVNKCKAKKKSTHLKNEENQTERAAGAAHREPHAAAGKRPKRAAARSNKTYKEPDTDDSHSEQENSPLKDTYPSACELRRDLRTKNKCEVARTKKTNVANCKSNNYNSERCEDVHENRKLNKRKVPYVQEKQEKSITPQDAWFIQQTSLSPSPVRIIENMRANERSAPTLDLTCSPLCSLQGTPLPASPNPSCQDIPSPILLLHKLLPTVPSKGKGKSSSFHSRDKKQDSSKKVSIPSPTSSQEQMPYNGCNAREENPFSAPPSPLTLHTQSLLTSTAIEQFKAQVSSPPQPEYPKDSVDYDLHFASAEVKPVFQASPSQMSSKSSVVTCRIKDSPATAQSVSPKTEKTPIDQEGELQKQPHVSGPCYKRHVSSPSTSEDEDRDREKRSKMRGQHSRLKPRKLFKSLSETTAGKELNQARTSSHIGSTSWEADEIDGDMDLEEDAQLPEVAKTPNEVFQHFSFELKKRFQNRYEMMDAYNKQSLKTAQQCVSSINVQVTKYRTQRLGQVQKVLLEEVHQLEQDDRVLKSMEKDLTMHSKKQTLLFNSQQKKETTRNDSLKRTLESYVGNNYEYEERLFTSQMGLMKKDMKSVQDRLLSEMQKKELQSVKRGLHALFLS